MHGTFFARPILDTVNIRHVLICVTLLFSSIMTGDTSVSIDEVLKADADLLKERRRIASRKRRQAMSIEEKRIENDRASLAKRSRTLIKKIEGDRENCRPKLVHNLISNLEKLEIIGYKGPYKDLFKVDQYRHLLQRRLGMLCIKFSDCKLLFYLQAPRLWKSRFLLQLMGNCLWMKIMVSIISFLDDVLEIQEQDK